MMPAIATCTGTLYVVVEQAGLIAILLKQPEGVDVAEVLELDQYAREYVVSSRNEFCYQVIVLLTANASALKAVVK